MKVSTEYWTISWFHSASCTGYFNTRLSLINFSQLAMFIIAIFWPNLLLNESHELIVSIHIQDYSTFITSISISFSKPGFSCISRFSCDPGTNFIRVGPQIVGTGTGRPSSSSCRLTPPCLRVSDITSCCLWYWICMQSIILYIEHIDW